MTKKLIGIVTIILILGIILFIGIRSIKADTRSTHPATGLRASALNELGTAASSNLLLSNVKLTQAQADLDQRLLSALQVNNALQLTALQDLLKPDALTPTNVDLGLLGLNS